MVWFCSYLILNYYLNCEQTEKYSTFRQSQLNNNSPSPPHEINTDDIDSDDDPIAEFARHRQTLITKDKEDWHVELQHYLNDMPDDVTPKMDLVDWWSVCVSLTTAHVIISNSKTKQENRKTYPTLARIALDVLPSQASSVPCERTFSTAKLTATDRRSCLKADIFEILQIMNPAWRDRLINLAEVNDEDLEQCDDEFMSFLIAEDEWETWQQE